MRRRRFATGHWANPARILPRLRRAMKQNKTLRVFFLISLWLGLQDSNLRMTGPKPVALPLGEGPICKPFYHKNKL